jgi:hypothetical protein
VSISKQQRKIDFNKSTRKKISPAPHTKEVGNTIGEKLSFRQLRPPRFRVGRRDSKTIAQENLLLLFHSQVVFVDPDEWGGLLNGRLHTKKSL